MSGSSSDLRSGFGAFALGCALIAMAATLLPWVETWGFTDRGIDRTEGKIVLVAALNASLAGALAAGSQIDRGAFARWAFASGGVMAGAIVWLNATVLGKFDPDFPPLCLGDGCARTDAGIGLHIAMLSAVAYLAAAAGALMRPATAMAARGD